MARVVRITSTRCRLGFVGQTIKVTDGTARALVLRGEAEYVEDQAPKTAPEMAEESKEAPEKPKKGRRGRSRHTGTTTAGFDD